MQLNVCLDLDHWKQLSQEQREEQIFAALCMLLEDRNRNKFLERAMTFMGSFVASLVTLVPAIWMILEKMK
jgi:hypothetical protein